jgi:hypothetical protein
MRKSGEVFVCPQDDCACRELTGHRPDAVKDRRFKEMTVFRPQVDRRDVPCSPRRRPCRRLTPMTMSRLWVAAIAVFVINLPFGFWRAGVKKFSFPWFLAVHAPVPMVIAVRLIAGLGWHLVTFPVLVGAFFAGQIVGGKLSGWWKGDAPA